MSTYGFKFYNNSNELVIDDEYTKPWFQGHATLASVTVSSDYAITDFTIYKLTYTAPSGTGVVYMDLPPNAITSVAYCLEGIAYTPGQNIVVYAAVSNGYSPVSADIPQIFCFNTEYLSQLTSGYGARINNASGSCIFDTNHRHLKIDTASDSAIINTANPSETYNNKFWSTPGSTNSKSGYAGAIELPAFLLPKIESDELVNNGDGTFTRNKYMGFYGRNSQNTYIWQPLVQSEIRSGTLSFTGSKLFNNKNQYDLIVQILPTACYAVPLAINQTTYDPYTSTVNWPSASYSVTLSRAYGSGETNVNEGAFGAGILGTVSTTNIASGTTLRYVLSGTGITASDFSSNSLEGTFTVGSNGTGTFIALINNDSVLENTEVVTCTVTRVGGGFITGSSNSFSILESATYYTITRTASEINEGDAFAVVCTSTKTSASPQVVNYTLSQPNGAAFDANDWTGTVALGSGASITTNRFTIPAGQLTAERTFTAAEDHRTDGDKTLRITLDDYTGTNTSHDIIVRDTSLEYTWALTGATSVNEGSTYTYSVTTNAPTGTRAEIRLVTPATADLYDIDQISGTTLVVGDRYYVSTTNGAGSFTIKIKADLVTEGQEYFTLALDRDDSTATRLATLTGSIYINDTSLTPEVWTLSKISGDPNTTDVKEGTTFLARVTSSGIPSYPKAAYYQFSGIGVTSGDIYSGTVSLTGTMSITSNSFDISIPIPDDYIYESDETVTLQIFADSGYSTPLTNAVSWTIHDALHAYASSYYLKEGNTITVTMESYGLAYPATIYGRMTGTGITASDFTSNSTDVAFTLTQAGTSTITIGAVADFISEDGETLTLTFYSDAGRSIRIGNTVIWTIADPVTYITKISAYPSTSSINEGEVLFYSITTELSVPRTLYVEVSGVGITGSDFYNGVSRYSVYLTSSTQNHLIGISGDSTTEGQETATMQVYYDANYTQPIGNSVSWTINDTSITPVPTYSFTRTPTTGNIDEGSTLTIGWDLTNIPSFPLLLYYTLTGTGITGDDVQDASNGVHYDLQRTFNFDGPTGSLPVRMVEDMLLEGAETATLTLYTTSARTTQAGNSLTWTINDTSKPTYTVAAFSSINEGGTGSCFVYTTGVPVGTTLYWTINNISTSNSDFSATSGSFTTVSGQFYNGIFDITTTADLTTEGSETFNVSIRTGSTSGPVVATSATATINDTSTFPTFTFTSAPATVSEGGSFTVSWSIANFVQKTLYYKITGSGITTGDTDIPGLSGSTTFTTATGTSTFNVTADHLTEGTETLTATWYKFSDFTSQVGNSVSWNISDTSINYPAYGTFNSSYCSGTTLVTVYNDGSGGTYSVSSPNNAGCGYIAPPTITASAPTVTSNQIVVNWSSSRATSVTASQYITQPMALNGSQTFNTTNNGFRGASFSIVFTATGAGGSATYTLNVGPVP